VVQDVADAPSRSSVRSCLKAVTTADDDLSQMFLKAPKQAGLKIPPFLPFTFDLVKKFSPLPPEEHLIQTSLCRSVIRRDAVSSVRVVSASREVYREQCSRTSFMLVLGCQEQEVSSV